MVVIFLAATNKKTTHILINIRMDKLIIVIYTTEYYATMKITDVKPQEKKEISQKKKKKMRKEANYTVYTLMDSIYIHFKIGKIIQ